MSGISGLKWPFNPTCLNDILDKDRLAVIESGGYERLGRPLTILDFDSKAGSFTHRIESIHEKQHYEEFCRFFRDDAHVKGGDTVCKNWDIAQAKKSFDEFESTGDPFRLFPCHLGLMDMTHVIRLRGRPLAVVFSGQFRPPRLENITESLNRMFNESSENIRIEDREEIENLKMLANDITPMPTNAREQLEQEVLHIQQIIEAEFELQKRQCEQKFLDDLRNAVNMPREITQGQMQEKIRLAVRLIKEFCQCEYVLFFAGIHENDTVLTSFAQAGLPANVEGQPPHFNWSKAKLPHANFILDQQKFTDETQHLLRNGIRGDNREHFANIACLIPNTIGDRYRSVLALGPFAEAVSLEWERQFLNEIAGIIGVFARTGFEVLRLEQERRRWENTATLLTHEYKTTLNTITMPIGMARAILQKSGVRDAERADEYLKQAEDRSLLLARITSGTLEGLVIKVEPEDLDIESYSLSALVENCVSGFMETARKKNLELVIDSSIGILPQADVDVPRLTIALANLVENAIKYSFSKSRIFIRSHLNITSGMDLASAIIEVDNIGFEIREQDRQRIFEVGERGGGATRIKRIPGSGYGLWEARSIVESHGGEIHVKIHPTAIHRQEGRASRVVFSIEIPLKHKK
ncbi:Virulence sensor protein BvgS [Anaerolineales bacterium]|nr:Virulence sensor protein BvgS [Anaerolineales bacterium]